MIDELMDSLVLDKLPTLAWLDTMLEDLLHGAEDIEPILHGFKNSLHLRVGVRDVLGKEDIRNTHRVLSDIAEVCLRRIAGTEYQRLCAKYGTPTIRSEDGQERPCEMVILALGKLGGREPNYHSDLDVVFLYEADGITQHALRGRSDQSTTNQHFFTQLGQRIIKVLEPNRTLGPAVRTGSSAASHGAKRRFGRVAGRVFAVLCRGPGAGLGTAGAVQSAAHLRLAGRRAKPSCKRFTEPSSARAGNPVMRTRSGGCAQRLEETATRRNLKRGPGGTVDIEFAVQALQLKHAADSPHVLQPGTLDAIAALHQAGCLSQDDSEYLSRSYRFLRSIEARLRLMNTAARHDLPSDETELGKLAYLLDYPSIAALQHECDHFMQENRRRCQRLFEQAAS